MREQWVARFLLLHHLFQIDGKSMVVSPCTVDVEANDLYFVPFWWCCLKETVVNLNYSIYWASTSKLQYRTIYFANFTHVTYFQKPTLNLYCVTVIFVVFMFCLQIFVMYHHLSKCCITCPKKRSKGESKYLSKQNKCWYNMIIIFIIKMRWCLTVYRFVIQESKNYWTDSTEIFHKAGLSTKE